MDEQFEWHIDEDEADEDEGVDLGYPASRRISLWWWVVVGVVSGSLLIGRWAVYEVSQSEETEMAAVQDLLDLEQEAFLAGDGELFFSAYAPDPAWRMAQLLPYNQRVAQADVQVTRTERVDDVLWANLSWEEGAETRQRVAFFQQQGNTLIHVPAPSSYWEAKQRVQYAWGVLSFYEVDREWQTTIADFITDVWQELCSRPCLSRRQTLTVHIRADYRETAVEHQIYVPSPRLMALDEAGAPAPLFWQQLRQKIEAHLTPAYIRFGVPAAPFPLLDYEAAAAEFMASYPHITVEIVTLEPESPEWDTLTHLDGAAVTPTEAMLAAGLVYNLTDLAYSDLGFVLTDFYEQIWQGAFWQDQMWFVPQTASMRLLYYDKEAYQEAAQPEPSLRWTWEEMGEDMAQVRAAVAVEPLEWGFLDFSPDALFSYAYNWKNQCAEGVTVRCEYPLEPEAVTAALTWYQQLVQGGEYMPDLTGLGPEERSQVRTNLQSAQRGSLIWVDVPVQYEYHLLIDPVGVVPFPGSDRFDGITPLWVQGNFMTQHTPRPLAVWEWLKFLSYQPPIQRFRLVPARPSIAISTGYWTNLPRPLSNAMRTAFPFARPVLIAEQGYFSWSQLAAMLSGGQSPAEAAHMIPAVPWFRQE